MPTDKPTVLIADDNPTMLRLLSRVLKIEGYRVLTALNGTTALKLAREEKSLALIILELEIARMDGIEVCRRLREFSNLPIIILTEDYEEDDILRATEAGADDFMPKPFDIADFVARVEAVLCR